MKKEVSFDSIGQVTATFTAQDGVEVGMPVKIAANGEVAPCAASDPLNAVAVAVKNGCAAVQVAGFVRCKATGLSVGTVKLSADGSGGVKQDEGGSPFLVVETDSESATVLL